jgi:hypothetical protein
MTLMSCHSLCQRACKFCDLGPNLARGRADLDGLVGGGGGGGTILRDVIRGVSRSGSGLLFGGLLGVRAASGLPGPFVGLPEASAASKMSINLGGLPGSMIVFRGLPLFVGDPFFGEPFCTCPFFGDPFFVGDPLVEVFRRFGVGSTSSSAEQLVTSINAAGWLSAIL